MLFSISCLRFSLITGTVSLLLTSLFSGALPAFAAQSNVAACSIMNGGFDNDFMGWETIGRTHIEKTKNSDGSTVGNKQAYLDTFSVQTADIVELAKFLETKVESLKSFGEVYEGSAIKTAITVAAGDTLSFDWNFLTDEIHDGDYNNDFAFFTLSQLGTTKIADTFSSLQPSPINSTDYLSQTGFHTYSYTFTTSGTYSLGIGVVDVKDGSFDSGLIIDNVSVVRPPL